MNADLITDNLPVLTPSALLLLAVLMLMRGTLVPRSVMDDRIKDRDRIIEEQEAHITSLEEANKMLRLGNQTTIRVVESLPNIAGVKD